MSNLIDYGSVVHARYHLECPQCNKAKGQVLITEQTRLGTSPHIVMTCKDCGLLGRAEFDWDWAVPVGVSQGVHGRDAAEALTIWLADHPPSAVDQLARIGRSAEAE